MGLPVAHDYAQVWTMYNSISRLADEGEALVGYWEHYLLDLKYLQDPKVTGCGFSCPNGWDVWPAMQYDPSSYGVTITDMNFIRKYPTFIYRGPSSVDDGNFDI